MQQIPNDGSYCHEYHGCGQSSSACNKSGLLRRLNLDKSPEGASVYFCEIHWNKEMQHRIWLNEKGVAEQWDVFDFYEPNPALEGQEQDEQEQEQKEEKLSTFYPALNIAVRGGERFDVYVTSWKKQHLHTNLYEHKIPNSHLAIAIISAREHLESLRRKRGMITIFSNVGDTMEAEVAKDRKAFCGRVFNLLESEVVNEGVLKYA